MAAPVLHAEISGYAQAESISDPTLINRAPMIDESGLVTWYAHSREPLIEEGGGSKVFVHIQGQRLEISKDVLDPSAANTQPRVQNGVVIWQTTRTRETRVPDSVKDVDLVEVPADRRDVPVRELAGFYAAHKATDAEGDVNLDPALQLYSGPYSNIYAWASAYLNSATGVSTNQNAAAGAPVADPARNEARRRSDEYGEIVKWSQASGFEFVTGDLRADISPSGNDRLIAWQRAKAFPFGWEIMAAKGAERFQITTNYYYDLGPKVYEDSVVWYGWDGSDYEIYTWDALSGKITQITTNDFDDVSPVIGKDLIAWESYPNAEAEIWCNQKGKNRKLSAGLEDNLNPVVWEGRVVWQAFDGDDFELMMFDSNATETDPVTGLQGRVDRLTNNEYDDVNPAVRDGLLVWMGYKDNWDAEIFIRDLATGEVKQITDNDYEDKDPQTAKRMVVWQADTGKAAEIFLATPDR